MSQRKLSFFSSTLCAAAVLAATPFASVNDDGDVLEAARRKSVLEALAVPLTINGEKVSEGAVRRSLVYSKGTTILESRKVDLFIEAEIERQVKAGTPRSKFELTSDDVDTEMEAAEARVREEFPDRSVEDLIGPAGLDRSGLRDQVEQGKLFDVVFLPENPREWPDTTVAAIQSQAGQEFIDKLTEGYDLRQTTGEEGDPDSAGHQLWKNIMRQFVMKALNDASLLTPASELPDDVALEVDGQRLMTEEIFSVLLDRGRLSAHDVNQERLWFAKTHALEQALRKAGYWIEDEEFEVLWEEEEAPYRDSPFNLQVIAVGFRKFPSMDAFKRYTRLLKSYERMIQDEINDGNLKEHLTRADRLLGLGKVRADVLLVSAFSFDKGRMKQGGWAEAEARSIKIAEELAEKFGAAETQEEQDAIWNAAMDKYSDFKDNPVAKSQQGTAENRKYNKGRFKLLHRNELVQSLGESDYSMFLTGTSVVDHIFFDQETGEIDGPFKGALGYYITKVVDRQSPTKRLSVENEGQRDLIRQDYLSVRFNQYAEEVLAASKVEGLAAR